jgi:transcriptional regulator with XRE-family HTH domain
MTLSGLRYKRNAAGLTQEELAKKSGVGRDTIQKLETVQRPARLTTIKKLADALGVSTEVLIKGRNEPMEETRTVDKVEVEVRWKDSKGFFRPQILRFRGKEIDDYEDRGMYYTLYECPGGYRVHVDCGATDEPAYLEPSRPSPYPWETEYLTYTAEELVKKFPEFGAAVGVVRVRNID